MGEGPGGGRESSWACSLIVANVCGATVCPKVEQRHRPRRELISTKTRRLLERVYDSESSRADSDHKLHQYS